MSCSDPWEDLPPTSVPVKSGELCAECGHAVHEPSNCPGCTCIWDFRKEKVNHPAHYGGDVPHEHWKCMVGSGLWANGFLYNCTKYLWRVGKKDGAHPLEDLRKARWYLDRAIEMEENK